MILGIFSTKTMLDLAASAVREHEGYPERLYYLKVAVDKFEPKLPQFFTMHPETLTEIPVPEEK